MRAIGDLLHPVIAKVQPALANKITGMLLEMSLVELLPLLASEERLHREMDRALLVLQPPSLPLDGDLTGSASLAWGDMSDAGAGARTPDASPPAGATLEPPLDGHNYGASPPCLYDAGASCSRRT